jgi:hypothetical protein
MKYNFHDKIVFSRSKEKISSIKDQYVDINRS